MRNTRRKPSKPRPKDASTEAQGQPADATTEAPDAHCAPGNEASPDADKLAEEETVLRDRLLRLQADFDNYRKRIQRERIDLVRSANEELLDALLPVLDHMDLALDSATSSIDDPYVQGFRLVHEQLLGTLNRFGLNPIDAKEQVFDPNLHEAISHIPSDEIPENNILHQTRRGYRLGERLLRPAQVVVSSGAPESAEACEAVIQDAAEGEPSNGGA